MSVRSSSCFRSVWPTDLPRPGAAHQAGRRDFTPPEISAFILRQLKRNAERWFKEPVSQAVITVPAYFNDAQRQATKDAGRIAGLEVLRLVNEPTAAALAYGLDKKQERRRRGVRLRRRHLRHLHPQAAATASSRCIATNGDTHLGGDDIDNLLLTIALEDIQGEFGVDLRRSGEAVQALRKAVIEAKIALSTQRVAAILNLELAGGQAIRARDHAHAIRAADCAHRERTVGPCRQAIDGRGPKRRADRRSGTGRRLHAHSAGAATGPRAVPAESRIAN